MQFSKICHNRQWLISFGIFMVAVALSLNVTYFDSTLSESFDNIDCNVNEWQNVYLNHLGKPKMYKCLVIACHTDSPNKKKINRGHGPPWQASTHSVCSRASTSAAWLVRWKCQCLTLYISFRSTFHRNRIQQR